LVESALREPDADHGLETAGAHRRTVSVEASALGVVGGAVVA
jgi:hypothetical protein